MSEQINGGPAFPVDTRSTVDEHRGAFGHQTSESTYQFPGMTLRDAFAIAALQGMMSDPNVRQGWDGFAKDSYDAADAMLKARDV